MALYIPITDLSYSVCYIFNLLKYDESINECHSYSRIIYTIILMIPLLLRII